MAMPKSELEKAKEEGLIEGLKDGQEIDLGGNDDDAGGEDDKTDPPAAKKEEEPEWKKELRAMEQKLARLEGENAALRAPKAPPKKEEEPDWEELLFTDPKQAVSLLKKTIREEITSEVTSAYKKDQGERDFWGSFYKEHDDLKDDDDLVKATLTKHLSELADLPVKKASERLAELTRERIMRYTGQNPKGGKKAVTEGAAPPSPGKKEPEKAKVVTLSDIIRARRAKRVNKATTA
jgi:hypothetical protein